MHFLTPISPDIAALHLLGAAMRSTGGVMRLRKSSFARILAAAPTLIRYRLDYGTGRHYPTFCDAGFDLRIVLTDDAQVAA